MSYVITFDIWKSLYYELSRYDIAECSNEGNEKSWSAFLLQTYDAVQSVGKKRVSDVIKAPKMLRKFDIWDKCT